MTRYMVQYIVEAEDEGAADAVWDAAQEEAYNHPEVVYIRFIEQVQLDD